MTPAEADALLRENLSLKTRLTKLSQASRRVSENLDLSIVLHEVIDNARHVTGALYGALLTYDKSRGMRDFITSGLSHQEIESMNALPRGLGLLGHISEIREPLRLTDIASHASSVGSPENHPPMKTFLGMPIRHRGERVGNMYLAEKDGGRQFTGEDQETLVMFASQAGAAISNAHIHREQQQVKADLEAMANIWPVAVLVFDGKTGDLLSFNDETRRMVGKLNGGNLPAGSYTLRASAYSEPGRGGDELQMLEVSFTVAETNNSSMAEPSINGTVQVGETLAADTFGITGRQPEQRYFRHLWEVDEPSNPGGPEARKGHRGHWTDSLDMNLPAKSSQIGTPWPTGMDSNSRPGTP